MLLYWVFSLNMLNLQFIVMIKILFFGQIAQFYGGLQIELPCPVDTDALINKLIEINSNLTYISYRIAINQVLINENTVLNAGDTVALMPAFSGG